MRGSLFRSNIEVAWYLHKKGLYSRVAEFLTRLDISNGVDVLQMYAYLLYTGDADVDNKIEFYYRDTPEGGIIVQLRSEGNTYEL